jgi:sterol-4alpha-carboxylate 3-dehydrogenase (decarboxylating)
MSKSHVHSHSKSNSPTTVDKCFPSSVDLDKNERVLVIGGDGFLGSHIVDMLASNSVVVHSADLQHLRPSRPDVVYHVCSLLDSEALISLLRSLDVTCVVHSASPSLDKSPRTHTAVSVTGTRNLLRACIASGVSKFVYTSSVSVVCDGNILPLFAKESLPYCTVPFDAYSASKAVAEEMVLNSNNLPTLGNRLLHTCALRVPIMFGERDRRFTPIFFNLLDRQRSHFVFGSGLNLYDFTYVKNAAYAHILAIQSLGANPPRGKDDCIDGEAFNITNAEPTLFWEFPSVLFRAATKDSSCHVKRSVSFQLSRHRIHIPGVVAVFFAYLLRILAALAAIISRRFPCAPITPYTVRATISPHVFSVRKAFDRLKYTPLYTMEEGISRTASWLHNEYHDILFDCKETGSCKSSL